MSSNLPTRGLAILLVVALVAPTAFFIMPQRVDAGGGVAGAVACIGSMLAGLGTSALDALGVPVTNWTIQTETTITGGATTGNCIVEAILIPLARALARLALAKLTSSIIGWITGKNGNGTVMFVQNLQGNLQTVGDTQASAFFAQFGRNSNSPFAAAISSSLRINYIQNTSSAGFFAANRNTMAQYSPNPNAFIDGNWSQGGVGAWFALTTQSQNNPYTFYQASQSQLASVVGSAQAARVQTLAWGQGFLSWCGVSDAATATQNSAATDYQTCQASGKSGAECQAAFDAAGGTMPSSGGVNPGDSCTNKDGTPGTIQTPGSTIHDYTQKIVVDAGIDQLISAQDLDAALGAIATAMIGQVLNGIGGLLGASTPQGRNQAFTVQLQNTAISNAPASAAASSIAQTKLAQVADFTSAWNTIISRANVASASLESLAAFCTAAAAAATDNQTFAAAATAQAVVARAAIPGTITPVITQANSAINSASTTKAFAQKLSADATTASSITSDNSAAASSLSVDTQTLVAMPPSVTDLGNAQQNTNVYNMARASPTGSITVSGGTLMDQMNLIITNAEALKASACTKPVAP